jgi:MFS family permease
LLVPAGQNLLSSVIDKSLALNALALLYFSFAASNLVAAEVLARLPVRLALCFAAAGYSFFMGTATLAAHGLAPPVLYLGAVVIGCAASVLWGAQYQYLTSLTTPGRIGHWQGVFFLLYGLAPLIGQGLALLLTGPAGLPGRTVFAVMFGVSWSGVALFLAVRPRPAYLPARPPAPRRPLRAWLPALARAARRMWRLWPLFLVSGLTSPYYNGYLAARLRLALTIQCLLLAGAGAVVGGFALSHASDLVPRRRIIYGVLGLQLAACVLSLAAVHAAGGGGDTAETLFRVAFALNGLCDGGFNTQTRAATAVAYPQLHGEASAVLLLFTSVGSATGFLYGGHLPQAAQVGIILAMAALAAIACAFLPLNAAPAHAAAAAPPAPVDAAAPAPAVARTTAIVCEGYQL